MIAEESAQTAIVPSKTALVVVDMQVAFLKQGEGHAFVASAVETVPTINRLTQAMRRAGGTVIWLKNIHDEETERGWTTMCAKAGPEGVARRAAALGPDRPGHALWPELEVEPGDPVVVKRRFSAFVQGSSNLEEILRGAGIDTLIFAGTTTDVCVESSARDAMMLDYEVIVVSDATSAITEHGHQASLKILGRNFAEVTDSETILRRIASP